MKNTPSPRITSGALTRWRDIMHHQCKSVQSVSSVGNEPSVVRENVLHPSVPSAGRKILLSSRLGPRMESAVNMNERTHDNMSASHGRCENGKENEKCKG